MLRGYGQPGGYGADTGTHDPFAALRADPPTQPPRQDYQYPQQADAFSNGQYSLPQQPAALSTYQPRPAAQQYDPYAQPAQTYAAQPAPQAGFEQHRPTRRRNPIRPMPASTTGPRRSRMPTRAIIRPALILATSSRRRARSRRLALRLGSGRTITLSLAWSPPSRVLPPTDSPPQPQAAGSFDQTYADDEADYDVEPPRRGWTRMAAILASTVLLGGGLTYAYTALMGGSPTGAPPVVKSAEGPSKVKPSDPGGKQFAHTDSKVMGRLEGGASDTETGSTSSSSSSSNVDSSGARKVPVLVVGRDGTIQPPAAPSDESGPAPARATVSSVPGLTVIDGFGGQPRPREITTTASEPAARPLVVSPPAAPVKPKVIAAATPTTLTDSGPADSEPAAAPPAKKAPVKKVAAVSPPAAVGGPAPSGAGYVAVLASVPASGSSRIDALKQRLPTCSRSTALSCRTRRLMFRKPTSARRAPIIACLVGPPGSRDPASQLAATSRGRATAIAGSRPIDVPSPLVMR